MEYRDYYKILGVPKTASQADIKKAFRKLAREHHPDVNTGDATAEQRFKDVNEAHAVLGDPEKRKQYDALGANWEAFSRAGAGAGAGGASPFGGFGFGGGSPGGGSPGGGIRYEFRTSGGEDISGFSDFFRAVFGGADPDGGMRREGSGGGSTRSRSSGGFEDILAQMGIDGTSVGRGGRSGGRGGTTQARPRPAATEATAELDLEEAFHGTTRLVDVGGKRLEVSIPKGVDSGSRIRLSGKGRDGGDLVVVVKVRPHPVFTRRGADLERELPLTLDEALLGTEVPVGTLKGRLVLTIPPGTQNGRTFRLTGQGMPRFKGEGAGDLYVKTKVVLPTLDEDGRKAARSFLDTIDQPNPREAR
jgi:curved DNA-binding protein